MGVVYKAQDLKLDRPVTLLNNCTPSKEAEKL
jgi:hypothetical protein